MSLSNELQALPHILSTLLIDISHWSMLLSSLLQMCYARSYSV